MCRAGDVAEELLAPAVERAVEASRAMTSQVACADLDASVQSQRLLVDKALETMAPDSLDAKHDESRARQAGRLAPAGIHPS